MDNSEEILVDVEPARNFPELLNLPLPSNKQAEDYVIGSMLKGDSDAVTTCMELLHGEDFYNKNNRTVFNAIMSLFNNNKPIDVLTVADALGSKLEEIGGVSYLAQVTANVFSTKNIRVYTESIAEKSVLRKLIEMSDEIRTISFSQDEKSTAIVEAAEQKITKIMQERTQKGLLHMRAIMSEALEILDKLRKAGQSITGVPTGFDDLDKLTSGLQKSDLIIIAARPSVGKTSFVLNIAQHAALENGLCTAIFSLEMSNVQVVNRLLAGAALVRSDKLKTGKLEAEDMRSIGSAVTKYANANIYIDDTPGISMLDMRAQCRRLKAQHKLDLVIIDYLQLMDSPDEMRNENRQQATAAISRSLKLLAKELNVPVLALSQLSRSAVQKEGSVPRLSDLRDSGAIEQDADIVMFLHREKSDNPDEQGICKLIIAKHRNGELGEIPLGWRGEYTAFFNLAPESITPN